MIPKELVEKYLKSIVTLGCMAQTELHNGNISALEDTLTDITGDVEKIEKLIREAD